MPECRYTLSLISVDRILVWKAQGRQRHTAVYINLRNGVSQFNYFIPSAQFVVPKV